MIRTIALLIFLVLPICIHAKKNRGEANDSLLRVLHTAKEDTNKVKILAELAFNYTKIDQDEGIRYGQMALTLAQKLKWDKGTAKSYNVIGMNYQNKAIHDTAMDYYRLGLKKSEELRDKRGIAIATENMAIVHASQSDYATALELHMKSLKMNEELGNKRGMRNISANIGHVYLNAGDDSMALQYLSKALQLSEGNGEEAPGALLGHIATIYINKQDYTTALEYLLKSLKFEQDNGNKREVARLTGSIGSIYSLQKNYTVGIGYMQKARKMLLENKDKKGYAALLTELGSCYIRMAKDTAIQPGKIRGNAETSLNTSVPEADIPHGKTALLRSGIKCLEESADLNREVHGIVQLSECYKELEVAYRLTGNYKKAMESAENYIATRDSVYSKEKDVKITRLQMQYDFEKKEATAKEEQEKKDIIIKAEIARQTNAKRWLLAGSVLLLIIAGGSIYFLYYTRKSKRAIEILMKEIHHRVKNNLQVISTLLQLQLKNVTDESAIISIEEGISRIGSIALIHQHLYKAQHLTSIEFSAFAKELLIQISSVYKKAGQTIDLQNDIAETWLDIDTALPLGLILNELMTNSYKYAFKGMANVKLTLKLTVTGNEYTLVYCDNGPGMPAGYEMDSSSGLGMTIITSLSRQLGGGFSYRRSDNCFVIHFLNTRARKNIA